MPLPQTKCPLCASSVTFERGSARQVPCPFCGTAVAIDESIDRLGATYDDPLIGKSLGGCRIESLIGEGGMGAVYKAWHEHLEAYVAVKTIQRGHQDTPLAVQRFEREAKVTARFGSPYVIKIMDTGSQEGVHFLVMEYVDGENLATYFMQQSSGVLAPEQGITFLQNAASALLESEHLGIVHRDIKPANLLVTLKKGVPEVVRIADFGVLRDTTVDPLATNATGRTNPLVGTPMFMSPEQLRLDPVDHRSDMYSLGASFFLMLTGEPPATGVTLETMRASKLAQKCLSPRRARPDLDIPKRLNAVIERMTALRPADRYPSFADLLADIDKARRAPMSRFARTLMLAAPVLLAIVVVLAIQAGNKQPAPSDPAVVRGEVQQRITELKQRSGESSAFAQVRTKAQELLGTIDGKQGARDLAETRAVRTQLETLSKAGAEVGFFATIEAAESVVTDASPTGPYREQLEALKKTAVPECKSLERDLASCGEKWRIIAEQFDALCSLEQAAEKEERRQSELVADARAATTRADDNKLGDLQKRCAKLVQNLEQKGHDCEQAILTGFQGLKGGPSLELTKQVEALKKRRDFLSDELRGNLAKLSSDLGVADSRAAAIERLARKPLPVPFDGLSTRVTDIENACSVGQESSPELKDWTRSRHDALLKELRDQHVEVAEQAVRSLADALLGKPLPASQEQKVEVLQRMRTVLAGVGTLEQQQWSLPAEQQQWPAEFKSTCAKLRKLHDEVDNLVFVSLPEDWPAWAKAVWPHEWEVPAELQAGSEENLFFWTKAPERKFVLIAGDEKAAPVLIERKLVSKASAYAYYKEWRSNPGTKIGVAEGDPSPVHSLTWQEALEIADRHLPVQLTFPTQPQLDRAARVIEAAGGLGEFKRAEGSDPGKPDSVFAGNTKLTERSPGDPRVSFRCCCPLQRGKPQKRQ